ncbi:MAG TPA: radical SAM protein [Ktedonobacterales bacterium]
MSPTPLPTYAQLEPVGQCNLRCQMCAIQFREDGPPYGPPAFMAFERFVEMLDALPGLQELHLQGLGEPMMHPRFFEMVAYATAKGIRVTTNSNATLLNERRAVRCVTSGLDCLHVSLDGATAATYERIRVRAHFERVTANVERLLTARERLGATTPRLRLVMVLMRQNLDELPDLVRLAQRWQVEGMFVQHLCHDFGESSLPARYRPMRAFVDEQTLFHEDAQRVEAAFAEARELARTLGVDLRLPRVRPRVHPPGTPGRERCDWPWRGAYISYEGYAMPCCMVSTPDRINFGNIAPQGFAATWNNPEYEAFREQLASDEPPEVCRSCAVYSGTF